MNLSGDHFGAESDPKNITSKNRQKLVATEMAFLRKRFYKCNQKYPTSLPTNAQKPAIKGFESGEVENSIEKTVSIITQNMYNCLKRCNKKPKIPKK